MKKMLTASAVAALALAISVPALAGGETGNGHCSGKSSASAATYTAGWSGAWLERSASGSVTVVEVAKGSPAARAGLKSGDVVLAVNGYDLADGEARAMCAAKASCKVGSAVFYTVNRSGSTRELKLKLEKMPANAAQRYASRDAGFDPMFAAVVMPISAN